MTKQEQIEKLQEIQMMNPPTSKEWMEASKKLNELVASITGKSNNDAKGKL